MDAVRHIIPPREDVEALRPGALISRARPITPEMLQARQRVWGLGREEGACVSAPIRAACHKQKAPPAWRHGTTPLC